MRRGEFEGIIEECLSALLEGRRSVEESLSLYPAWRGRLEPLLRAAEEIAAGLDQVPPRYARERGLQRFLEAARARRRLRQILPRAKGTPWWLAPAGLAALIVMAALASMSETLVAEEGGRLSDPASVLPYSPSPQSTAAPAVAQTPLQRVQEGVGVLEDAVREGEPVSVGLLRELEEASGDLAADLDQRGEMELIDRVAAVSATSRGWELLQRLQEGTSGIEAQALAGSLAAAEEVLEKLGATPAPEPSPAPEATPSPAASPSPEPSPTAAPSGTASPGPTPSQ